MTRRKAGAMARLTAFLTATALVLSGCAAPDPLLSFLDAESSLSFTHPPHWSVGFAEQNGIRYRYLTAPKVENDKEVLSITLISPTLAASKASVAEAYLAGGVGVSVKDGVLGSTEWSFKEASGVSSRLRVIPLEGGRFFGAWARGSEIAMSGYAARIKTLMDSLRVENAAEWPEERFAGMALRVPLAWTRGSRFSNPTNATMQFKSLPLAVEKEMNTIHGFITLSKEPVPSPGGLAAFSKAVKDRSSDTVALLQHGPWPGSSAGDRPDGFVDFLRSGTTLTSTRIRRFIAVKAGVGFTFSCEARADAFDRLEPWCRRVAETVRIE